MSAKEKLAESTFSSLAAMMAAYAEEAIQLAWANHRRRLDYSDASVEVLEQILDTLSADDLEFQSRLWGGFFGELLRKRFEGEWELSHYPGDGSVRITAEPPALVPALVVRGSRLYPLIKIYRRLTLGSAESLSVFYRMVEDRLSNRPAVPPTVQ